MDLLTLNKQIQQGNLDRFYIFTGEELTLQQLYIENMGKYQRVDTVAEIYNKITSKGLFDRGSTTYVVRDDQDFMKAENAWKDLNSRIKTGRLILCVTNPDAKKKFIKDNKDRIVEFKHMTTTQLMKRLEHLKLTDRPGILKYLIETCQNDYNTILNTIDQFNILQAAGIYPVLSKEVIDSLVPPTHNETIFDLALNLINRSPETINILDHLLENETNPLGIITVIYKYIHDCILIEGYRDDYKVLPVKTGLPGWRCKQLYMYNKIPPAKLLAALRLMQKYDNGIKSGIYSPKMGVYILILKILYI